MDKQLILQVASSFVVGGGFIALLTLIAEKVDQRVAGIVLSLPSTSAISFIFMGLVLSPQAVKESIVVVPAAVGGILVFALFYVFLANYLTDKFRKTLVMVFSLLLALISWSLLAIPFALVSNPTWQWSWLVYLFGFVVSYYFLTFKGPATEFQPRLKYTLFQKIARGGFAGLIVAVSVYLAKTLSKEWGAVFGAFPAVYTSSVLIFHWYYNEKFLFRIFKEVPRGSIVFLSFVLGVWFFYVPLGIWWGTVVAYVVAGVVFFLIDAVRK